MDPKQTAGAGEAHSTNTPGQIDTKAMDTAHDAFLGVLDKFTAAKPEEREALMEEVTKGRDAYKTERQKITEAKAAADKAKAEAEKNYKAPDYKTVPLPKDSRLGQGHYDEVVKLAAANKWDLETFKTVLQRDHDLVEGYRKGVDQEFKDYNAKALETLKKDWGAEFETNTTAVKKTVDLFEKQIPGIKGEITRLGLDCSVTANKFFKFLHDELGIANDKFEFGGKKSGKDPADKFKVDASKFMAPSSK